jgi:hypothetical protein
MNVSWLKAAHRPRGAVEHVDVIRHDHRLERP